MIFEYDSIVGIFGLLLVVLGIVPILCCILKEKLLGIILILIGIGMLVASFSSYK